MSLYGVDLSHHNSDVVFNASMKEEDFIILKATEGRTYQDPAFARRQKQLITGNVLRAYYHYARPENNAPEDEVNNFLKTIGNDAYGALLILDWEGNALKCDFNWALEWFTILRNKIKNARPILYASASVIRKYKDLIVNNDLSVWTAHYNEDCSDGCDHDGGIVELMTQYTSSPVDRDVFHAERESWKNFTANGCTSVPEQEETIAEWTEGESIYRVTRVKKG